MVYCTGGEHLGYTTPAPGTPAPGAATVSRVVAAGQSPTTTSNIARLASRGAPTFKPTASLLPATHCATPDPSICVYVPYRHIQTGERAMIPLRLDPATGTRTPVVPPPADFHPAVVDGAGKSPNLLQWLAGLELAEIYDWIADFVGAFGSLRDSTAHLILTSPGWHAMLAGGHPQVQVLVDAEKSVADCCTFQGLKMFSN